MVEVYYLQFAQYFVDVTALFTTRKGTYEIIVKYVKPSLGGQGEIDLYHEKYCVYFFVCRATNYSKEGVGIAPN